MTKVMTVLGEIRGEDLGRTLPHEHIASVYGVDERQANTLHGEGKSYGRPRSDQERAAFEECIRGYYAPTLTRLRQEHDCRAIVEVSGPTGEPGTWSSGRN